MKMGINAWESEAASGSMEKSSVEKKSASYYEQLTVSDWLSEQVLRTIRKT